MDCDNKQETKQKQKYECTFKLGYIGEELIIIIKFIL